MCVCVHSLCGSNPDLGWGPFLTFAPASLSPASPSVRRLYPKSSKWLPFLSSQILPVTLTSVRGEKKRRRIVGSERTCVSKRHQECFVTSLTLTPPIRLTSTWVCSCNANITRECWIKALLQVKSDFFFYLKESSHLKNLFSCALIILSPDWLTVWSAAAIMP